MLTTTDDEIDAGVTDQLVAEKSEFMRDCLAGLRSSPKTLPCKWFYDAEGSRLFEMICELPEYYQTRTEAALLTDAMSEISLAIEPGTVLVEYGSGASVKTRILLDAADQVTHYVPIDICEEELLESSATIRARYPDLSVEPIHADFTKPIMLDAALQEKPLLGFFPGSTIGNFELDQAAEFLKTARCVLGKEGRMLLGVDLRKDIDVLTAAYDDAAGVTAAFNLNLLERMRRELGAHIARDGFVHRAIWNQAASRIEMHLESKYAQSVEIGGEVFHFEAGETIHTENCHKYSLTQIGELAARSGWDVENEWVSPKPEFAILMLAAVR